MKAKACWAIACAATVAACAGQDGRDPPSESEPTSTTSALDEALAKPGKVQPIYVLVNSAEDVCTPTAACGLARIRPVNERRRPELVRLDESGLSRQAIEQMAGAQDGTLVLRGVLARDDGERARLPTFTVLEAWRGMPGVEPSRQSAYVRVEMSAGHLFAQFLDEERRQPIREVSLASGVAPVGNGDWLASRVLGHYGLVAGTFDRETLEATQVFVHLPDVPGPCPMLIVRCEEGTVATYERDANHCLEPTGCVSRGICPMYIPACASGYTLASWASKPGGCAAFACDPAFVDMH
ncbi:MAG TPA: hypothetical protein VF765_01130 [Polyangiaceae bacterium]